MGILSLQDVFKIARRNEEKIKKIEENFAKKEENMNSISKQMGMLSQNKDLEITKEKKEDVKPSTKSTFGRKRK